MDTQTQQLNNQAQAREPKGQELDWESKMEVEKKMEPPTVQSTMGAKSWWTAPFIRGSLKQIYPLLKMRIYAHIFILAVLNCSRLKYISNVLKVNYAMDTEPLSRKT